MFRFIKGFVLIFTVLSTNFAFAQDSSGSTKLTVDQCYEGEHTEFASNCIPSCICVTADNCPCCTIGDLIAILNPERQAQNKVIVNSVEKFRAMQTWEFDEQRRETLQSKVPSSDADKQQYFTNMALMFLPDDRLNKIGIKRDEHTSGGVGFDIPFEFVAYSACWWGGVAGGGDVIDVGDDCKDEWLD